MKPIFFLLVFVSFLFSIALQAQNSSSKSLDKVIYYQNNQLFESFIKSKFISEENRNDFVLNTFSKDLRSELSSSKWNTVLNENNNTSTNMISMIKIEDKNKINLFGNPLMGFTEKKLTFDEPALFSNTVLVYSF